MEAIVNDKCKFEYLLGLLPENIRNRYNAPDHVSIDFLKRTVFSIMKSASEGTIFKSHKKINGKWHHVKRDGSLYGQGLSRPNDKIEKMYIESLPEYKEFVEGDGFFINQ